MVTERRPRSAKQDQTEVVATAKGIGHQPLSRQSAKPHLNKPALMTAIKKAGLGLDQRVEAIKLTIEGKTMGYKTTIQPISADVETCVRIEIRARHI